VKTEIEDLPTCPTQLLKVTLLPTITGFRKYTSSMNPRTTSPSFPATVMAEDVLDSINQLSMFPPKSTPRGFACLGITILVVWE
jgi:hypothetical protein